VRAGWAVQLKPMRLKLKAPGTKPLKLKCDKLLSTFAFNFNLCRYTLVGAGADANRTTTCGQTPLSCARQRRRRLGPRNTQGVVVALESAVGGGGVAVAGGRREFSLPPPSQHPGALKAERAAAWRLRTKAAWDQQAAEGAAARAGEAEDAKIAAARAAAAEEEARLKAAAAAAATEAEDAVTAKTRAEAAAAAANTKATEAAATAMARAKADDQAAAAAKVGWC